MSEMAGDYWHPLDKETAIKYHLDPRTVGTATPPFKGQLDELRSRIFQGTSHVELGFMGRPGKGSLSQGNTNPEMYGKDEREAMRELAKINDVSISTHASTAISGMAGMGERQFDDQARDQTLTEMKRAIDFAADMGGGPVVVHTGEFPKGIGEREGFKGFPEEDEKGVVYSVDKRSGKFLPLPKDTEIPVLQRDKETGRPIVDPETGQYKFKVMKYNNYVENEKEIKKELIDRGFLTEERAKELGPAQLFYLDHMGRQFDQVRAESTRYTDFTKRASEQYNMFKQLNTDFEEASKRDAAIAKRNLRAQMQELKIAPRPGSPEFRDFIDNPQEYLKKATKSVEGELKQMEQGIASYGAQTLELKEQMKNLSKIEEVGLDRTAETISRAAMHAMAEEKRRGLKKPVIIAPENLFPEGGYGAHPEELREVIVKSRNRLVKDLQQKGYSKDEAAQLAKSHIKATFDIGHANTWKKYFVAKPGEKPDQVDKRFKKWVLGQVDKLTKEGIIGHVHITDNFGYYDEHLTPGEGNAPIKEMVEQMKKRGYEGKMIVEPAHQDYKAMLGAWRTFNSPMYRIDGSTSSWTDISSSYFGKTGSPTYIVGDYAPDKKEWTFWSETQIE